MTAHNYELASKGPSRNGYRKGCRCDPCIVAGREFLEYRRAADRRRQGKKVNEKDDRPPVTTHGVGGYQRGCRCRECVLDMRDLRRSRTPVDPVDWSDVEHLKAGAGVRRRTRGD